MLCQLFARHGNTFGPGDKVSWVGRTNDLPLVPKGFEQAQAVASYLQDQLWIPSGVYCSPLRRTRDYALTILEQLQLPLDPIVTEALNEVDYGDWAGLSQNEIIARFGDEELNAWNEASTWPTKANWGSDEAEIIVCVKEFLTHLQQNHHETDQILLISSNGVLRYFLKFIPNAWDQSINNQTFKMKTGHISKLNLRKDAIELEFWDKKP